MEGIVQIFQSYIDERLLVMVPVLYIIARYLDGSRLQKRLLPIVLLGISVTMTMIYMLATMDIHNPQTFLEAVFCAVVQGVLLSGAAVFGGILMETMKKPKDAA